MAETTEVTWHPVEELPDEGALVLVYCKELDDVVFGFTGRPCDDVLVWLNSDTGYQLVAPQKWADVPFPALV